MVTVNSAKWEYTVAAAFNQDWSFHIRVRALNNHGAGPWSTTTEANRIRNCGIDAPLVGIAPEDTSETVEPQTEQSNTEPGSENTGNGNDGNTNTGNGNSEQNDGGNGNGGNGNPGHNIDPVNTEPAQQNEEGQTENTDAQPGNSARSNTQQAEVQPGGGNDQPTTAPARERPPEEDARTTRVVQRYDVNNNGRVDLDEVLTAIGDYFLTDTLTLDDILALLRQYTAA